jgi:hypothetical protein
VVHYTFCRTPYSVSHRHIQPPTTPTIGLLALHHYIADSLIRSSFRDHPLSPPPPPLPLPLRSNSRAFPWLSIRLSSLLVGAPTPPVARSLGRGQTCALKRSCTSNNDVFTQPLNIPPPPPWTPEPPPPALVGKIRSKDVVGNVGWADAGKDRRGPTWCGRTQG